MVTDGLRGIGPARPTRIASYSVSVRQVAALLPRFFQTAPRDGRPCASLALCLTGPGQRTFTSKLSNMLGTPGAVDAKNAPTAPWETGRPVCHSYHRLCLPSLVTGRVSPMFPVNFVTYVPGCTRQRMRHRDPEASVAPWPGHRAIRRRRTRPSASD